MTVLLATKLHQPSPPPRRVQRPHLIHRLNEGLASGRQITLVSAPAGFGKTTCISDWVNGLDRWPVAWLSLDVADDDPGRFFAYFVAALQKVDANLGREIQDVLRSGQLPPSEIISTALINDILDLEVRFLLVLDDLHVIQDHFILQVLENLVTNLPQPLHLILLTREDPPLPLARLRANNQLTEIRAGDLRFTGGDTERFLNEVMGLDLSAPDITALENKTEGWIVGLQLAAIALQSPTTPQSPLAPQSTIARQPALSLGDWANPSSFIATLSGSHRFILSYLTEEVLSRQPDEIQHFLLQTSILDQLNGDLCNAVTGRSDCHALLERLFNANLFLSPLDDHQQWYRYHHLFADLLRDRQNALQKDRTAELHRRASYWYAQAGGEREAFVSQAVQHALAAEDYAMAVQLLESHATGMVMQGYAKTVDGWLQTIPQEWRSQGAKTNLAFAWMHGLRGNYSQAFTYLERVQATKKENPSIRAEWLALQSLMLNMQGQATESLALANEALQIAPEDDSHVRSLAYFGLAGVYQLMDDYAHAVEAYQLAIQDGRASGNLVAEMMSISGLAVMAFQHGQLHLAFDIASPASERAERAGSLPPISAVVYGVLGQIHYQWYQLEEARSHILRAIHLSSLGGYNSGAIYYGALLSRLLQLEGDLEAAAQEMRKAVDQMQMAAPADIQEEVIYHQVRVSLAQDRLAAAETALERVGFSLRDGFSFPDLKTRRSISHPTGSLYNSALRLILQRARTRHKLAGLGPGIELADRLIARALQSQAILVALEALLLRGQMHAALGDGKADLGASRSDYVRALELAEPEGIVSIFVEEGSPLAEALASLLAQNQLGSVQRGYVKNILGAFASSRTSLVLPAETGPVALIEPLTDRELDVLRLMAEGLKYAEIAEGLFVSLNTVRSHVKAIYGKLDVNNRTQAIERARQLQIL